MKSQQNKIELVTRPVESGLEARSSSSMAVRSRRDIPPPPPPMAPPKEDPAPVTAGAGMDVERGSASRKRHIFRKSVESYFKVTLTADLD